MDCGPSSVNSATMGTLWIEKILVSDSKPICADTAVRFERRFARVRARRGSNDKNESRDFVEPGCVVLEKNKFPRSGRSTPGRAPGQFRPCHWLASSMCLAGMCLAGMCLAGLSAVSKRASALSPAPVEAKRDPYSRQRDGAWKVAVPP
jgi:hypothetical protein